jgi:hypothetical protein
MAEIAYEYFDKKKKLFETIAQYKMEIHESGEDLEMDTFEMLDEHNKPVAKGKISLVAVYNCELSLWQWAWCLPFYKKTTNYISRKLLHYALDIDTNSDDILKSNKDVIFKSVLLNSKLHLQWPNIETEYLLAMSLYLTKHDFYYSAEVTNIEVSSGKNVKIADTYYLLKDITIL